MKFITMKAILLCCIIGFSAIPNTAEYHPEVGYIATLSNQHRYISTELLAVANDVSSLPTEWHLTKIMAPQAWQITSGESDILIAILDTGIDQNHDDLIGKVVANINFTNSPTADDHNGHGTHIAGIVAATADNARGNSGVAYNSSLKNVKVADDGGWCDSATVAEGIIWAVDNGANVINISLTFNKPSLDLENAVNYAWDKGAVIVAAAGNNYNSTPVYPSAYSNVIAVAATDKDDQLPRWSNYGDWISIFAPGVDIYSTSPDNNYVYASGTSPAAAIVSGEAALLFAIAKDNNSNGYVNDEVRNSTENMSDLIEVNGLGKGRVNVLNAVKGMGSSSYLDIYAPDIIRSLQVHRYRKSPINSRN